MRPEQIRPAQTTLQARIDSVKQGRKGIFHLTKAPEGRNVRSRGLKESIIGEAWSALLPFVEQSMIPTLFARHQVPSTLQLTWCQLILLLTWARIWHLCCRRLEAKLHGVMSCHPQYLAWNRSYGRSDAFAAQQ